MKAKPLPPIQELRRMFAVRSDGVLVQKAKIPYSRVRPGEAVGKLRRDGYLAFWLFGQSCAVHRVVWAIANKQDPGKFDVDHVDRNRTNNRPQNLRLATRSQNCANRQTKGFTRRRNGKYLAYVYKNYRQIFLGSFGTAEEARAAHEAAKIQLFGDYAHV